MHQPIPHLWQRSPEGPLGGVCEGLGQSFGINPKLLRFFWLLSLLLYGSGLLLYVLLYFVLPLSTEIKDFQESKILGVCYNYARAYHLDLGLLRLITVLVLFGSLGSGVLLYFILYLFAPKEPV